MPKKKWESPKLIILVKGKTEEKVLVTCKSWYIGGPSGSVHRCGALMAIPYWCEGISSS